MDDRRFDSLVKSLAEGANRRSVLKGILGLGGTAVVGATLLEGNAEAARRPDPTPTPVKCPGTQTWNGTACVCISPPAPGPHKCGSDCCTGETDAPYPRPATHSECCDNECCFGTCYGEELCCPTNVPAGGGSPTHHICEGPNGTSCCGIDQACCDGVCCDTVCADGGPGTDACCDEASFCPGGGYTDDVCCTGNTICCHGGTDQNGCYYCCGEGCCRVDDDCRYECDICVDGACVPGSGFTCTPSGGAEGSGLCCWGDCIPDGECCSNEDCPGGICCNGACCDGGCFQGYCYPCEELCVGSCGLLESGCECGDCPQGEYCTQVQTCCPGEGPGSNENCRFCGDVCGQGRTCQPDGMGWYSCVSAVPEV